MGQWPAHDERTLAHTLAGPAAVKHEPLGSHGYASTWRLCGWMRIEHLGQGYACSCLRPGRHARDQSSAASMTSWICDVSTTAEGREMSPRPMLRAGIRPELHQHCPFAQPPAAASRLQKPLGRASVTVRFHLVHNPMRTSSPSPNPRTSAPSLRKGMEAAPITFRSWEYDQSAGGRDAFDRLIDAFYYRVEQDELLSPLFPEWPLPRGAPEERGRLVERGVRRSD